MSPRPDAPPCIPALPGEVLGSGARYASDGELIGRGAVLATNTVTSMERRGTTSVGFIVGANEREVVGHLDVAQ